MKNETSTPSRNELLRELVIATGLVAMLLTGVGGLYWMQSRPTEATAGTTVAATVKTTDSKPEPGKSGIAAPGGDGTVIHADVYFDFKSTRLRADAAKMLQDKAATMSRTETWVVLVTGHSDSQGPAAYNKTLAQRRADVVKQFLVELGVPESAIKVVALGPEAALCDDPGKACQQLNRRVHLEIRSLGPVAVTTPLAPKSTEFGQP